MFYKEIQTPHGIRVKYGPGISIENVCAGAVVLATQKNQPVLFTFDGIVMTAYPQTQRSLKQLQTASMRGDTTSELVKQYFVKKARRDASKGSKSRESGWQPQNSGWRVRKRKLDRLIEKMKTMNVGDFKPGLEWLCELAELAPKEVYDYNQVVRYYTACGWRMANVKICHREEGETKKAWRLRIGVEGEIRRLVGFALSNILNEGVPHPKFLGRAKKLLVRLKEKQDELQGGRSASRLNELVRAAQDVVRRDAVPPPVRRPRIGRRNLETHFNWERAIRWDALPNEIPDPIREDRVGPTIYEEPLVGRPQDAEEVAAEREVMRPDEVVRR